MPSVSINRHFPSPPPMSNGSWQVTARVWQIWLLPVRNSPKISVTEPVSMPPARRVSSCFEPVVIEINSLRRWCISVAVVKPIGTSLEAFWRDEQLYLHMRGSFISIPSARILVAFCSDIPLICSSTLLGLENSSFV